MSQARVLKRVSLRPLGAWQRGMSLVEVMIAMLILSFISLALMQTVLFNIQVNTKAQLREIGSNLASEKLDEVKNIPFGSLPSRAATSAVRSLL